MALSTILQKLALLPCGCGKEANTLLTYISRVNGLELYRNGYADASNYMVTVDSSAALCMHIHTNVQGENSGSSTDSTDQDKGNER